MIREGSGFTRIFYTALLLQYQAMTNRNINAATSHEQYSVLVEKEQWGDFLHG